MSERQNHPPLRSQAFRQNTHSRVLIARRQVVQDADDQNGVENNTIWQSA